MHRTWAGFFGVVLGGVGVRVDFVRSHMAILEDEDVNALSNMGWRSFRIPKKKHTPRFLGWLFQDLWINDHVNPRDDSKYTLCNLSMYGCIVEEAPLHHPFGRSLRQVVICLSFSSFAQHVVQVLFHQSPLAPPIRNTANKRNQKSKTAHTKWALTNYKQE